MTTIVIQPTTESIDYRRLQDSLSEHLGTQRVVIIGAGQVKPYEQSVSEMIKEFNKQVVAHVQTEKRMNKDDQSYLKLRRSRW